MSNMTKATKKFIAAGALIVTGATSALLPNSKHDWVNHVKNIGGGFLIGSGLSQLGKGIVEKRKEGNEAFYQQTKDTYTP